METGFVIDNLYYLIILVLPLLGLISSNIYSTSESREWYNNIKFNLPDLTNRAYGMYLSAYIYLCAGLALVIILNSIERKSGFIRKKFERTTSVGSNWFDRTNSTVDSIILWLLPVIFFLIYLSVPLMYQTQNLLIPAIIYILIFLLTLCFTFYSIKFSWTAFFLLLPLTVWVIYSMIFLFASGDNTRLFSRITTIEQCPPPNNSIRRTLQLDPNDQNNILEHTETTLNYNNVPLSKYPPING